MDIEASGIGAGSYPIEVGFVLPDGQACCTLIRPAPGWVHWDRNAEAVHGIPRECLFEHGRPVQEVAAMLNQGLQGRVVYSDAWGLDYAWLSKLFDEAGRLPAFRLEHLTRIVPEISAERWNRTRAEIGARLGLQRHRASADARLLQLTWLALCGPDSATSG